MSPEGAGHVFAFISGTGRCGSTLVQEVLARHEAVGFVTNVQDRFPALPLSGQWTAPLYRRLPPAWARKGRLRIAPSEAYEVLRRRVSPLVVSPGRPLTEDDASPWLAARFATFFQHGARVQDKPVFLHKFTGWPRTGLVEKALPGTRYIHVLRDGRAVANSLVQMPWWRDYRDAAVLQALPAEDAERWHASGRSFVVLAGILWALEVQAHEKAWAKIPAARWMAVRYEDALRRPRDEFGRMLDFLGLEWDSTFDKRFSRQRFDPRRFDAYRRDLSHDQLRLLEGAIGDRLRRHGYEV